MKNSGNFAFLLTLVAILSLSFVMGMCQSVPLESETPVNSEPPPKPVIVAVVDTGFDFDSKWSNFPGLSKPRACKYGHKDFTGLGLKDNHGHGTHIAGLIAKYAGKSNYCLVILKYYNKEEQEPNVNHMANTVLAFQRAINLKVDVINYSGGGIEKNDLECSTLKQALDMGIVVVTAAGNESSDINKKPYYPAMCDDRIVAVANIENNGSYALSSNYSNSVELKARGLYKEKGTVVLSTLPNNNTGLMTGTSQSAAIRTGKIIKDLEKR